MLEKFADWKSILIEAHRVSFSKLKTNRPKAVSVNSALCSTSRVVHYVHSQHATVGGIYEFMPKSFIQQWHPEIHAGNLTVKDFTPIMCSRVKSILQRLRVREIDIWVLDVEGAELSVLRGMDFSQVRVKTVVMECDGHDQANDHEKRRRLERNGFQCQQVVRNCMCTHQGFVPSRRPQTAT